MNYRDLVELKSPPSTYAVADYMDGQKGAWYRVLEVTVNRAFFIGTGLYLAGFRGKDLLRGSLVSSFTVTAWLMAGYRSNLIEMQEIAKKNGTTTGINAQTFGS